jgi:hypothetical protein
MSSYSKANSSNSNRNSTRSNKPFCKVCYDAGKSEREYTSHYVKSKPGEEGKVVCPYLLSLVCSYCKKKAGHTARHCPVLLEKEKQNKKEDGWKHVSRKSNKYPSETPTRSRLADTPPPCPVKDEKVNSWAMIASGKPVVVVPAVKPDVPTPSPTPDAVRRLNEPSRNDNSSDNTEEEESVEEPEPAPYRYVYGAGSCWADEE